MSRSRAADRRSRSRSELGCSLQHLSCQYRRNRFHRDPRWRPGPRCLHLPHRLHPCLLEVHFQRVVALLLVTLEITIAIITLAAVVAIVVVIVSATIASAVIVVGWASCSSDHRWSARVATLPMDQQRLRAVTVTRQCPLDWCVAHHDDFEFCELLKRGEVLQGLFEVRPALAIITVEGVAVQTDVDGDRVQIWRLRAPKCETLHERTEFPVRVMIQNRIARIFNNYVHVRSFLGT
jgi:hypothetical protein